MHLSAFILPLIDLTLPRLGWPGASGTRHNSPGCQGRAGLSPLPMGSFLGRGRIQDSLLVHPAELFPPSLVQSWPLQERQLLFGIKWERKAAPQSLDGQPPWSWLSRCLAVCYCKDVFLYAFLCVSLPRSQCISTTI